MGQVARHKATKVEARERPPRPVYQLRRREADYWRVRLSAERELQRFHTGMRHAVQRIVEPLYAAFYAEMQARNLAAGVYGPGHSDAVH